MDGHRCLAHSWISSATISRLEEEKAAEGNKGEVQSIDQRIGDNAENAVTGEFKSEQ